MPLNWCDECRGYHFDYETCNPIFKVRCIDVYGIEDVDDWREIRAVDAESAAEEYCETLDGDGDITGSGGMENISVMDKDGIVHTYNVCVEFTKHYRAVEKINE